MSYACPRVTFEMASFANTNPVNLAAAEQAVACPRPRVIAGILAAKPAGTDTLFGGDLIR